MKILDYMEQYNHEQLAFYTDKAVGLRAIIAIHDTTLGPALGGCRMWKHATEEDAILDALRLARGMTYKSAAAGLNFGGGKAVIIGDPTKDKSEALFRAFGQFVDTLGGRYITTEDVGTAPGDLEYVATQTAHVVGLSESLGGSGDPSYATSVGVYEGIKASLEEALGDAALAGKVIAIQGFGKVAHYLAQHLKEDKVKLIVTDVNKEKLKQAKEEFNATVVSPEKIFDVPCDVFAPCALGGALNDSTIPRLRCKIVAGCANNQLLEDRHAELLAQRGILYAPDYVINAGGVINLSFEMTDYDEEAALERVRGIGETLKKVYAIAKKEKTNTARAADRLAEERIAQARKVKRIYPG